MDAYRFRPTEAITLGEFSQMVVKGLQIPLSITASHFTDVPRGHRAFKYIETLYDYSTQSERPFFDFEPSKNYKSARVYPEEGVSEARALKILSGLLRKKIPVPPESDEPLTRAAAAILIAQSL